MTESIKPTLQRHLAKVFDAWWAIHGDYPVKTKDLAPEVLKLMPMIPEIMPKVSRQYAASFVARFANQHIDDYYLESRSTTGKKHKPGFQYRLTRQADPTTSRSMPVVCGV